jgi:hypothetical protein
VYPRIDQPDHLTAMGWVVCPAMSATHLYDRERDSIRELPVREWGRDYDRFVPVHGQP